MSLVFDIARAVITSLKERANELTAGAVLEESLRDINKAAAPHWRSSSVSELPSMIRELAQDRDDFKKMSIAYREDLADAEDEVRKLKERVRELTADCAGHEIWCGVYSACTCGKDDG